LQKIFKGIWNIPEMHRGHIENALLKYASPDILNYLRG
jgi:hypothetical protein